MISTRRVVHPPVIVQLCFGREPAPTERVRPAQSGQIIRGRGTLEFLVTHPELRIGSCEACSQAYQQVADADEVRNRFDHYRRAQVVCDRIVVMRNGKLVREYARPFPDTDRLVAAMAGVAEA